MGDSEAEALEEVVPEAAVPLGEAAAAGAGRS